MAKWMLRQSTADIATIARQNGIAPVLARILAVRGYTTPEEAGNFLDRKPKKLADPFLFADMDKAVQAASAAIKNGRRIAIFGDYDADGVMSTVILYYTLQELGADPVYYIPSREEGYGLNNNAIDSLAGEGINFIITCDNGISAIEEINYADSLGIDVIVLDHHTVTIDENDPSQQMIPNALAVVDAKRLDCTYPYKEYCGAGIAYRFSQALYKTLGRDWQALGNYCLPFVTIATICDLVDMTGENREIVRLGLSRLAKCQQPGVKSLLSANGLTDKEIGTYHIGFIVGPCINAAGRLDVADTAVELFLTDDDDIAADIAAELVEMNLARRQLTEDGTELAVSMIEKESMGTEKIIVLQHEDFPESVAGIIAGKIKERYHRPTIIIAGSNDLRRGSCRSIEAYNIFDGLSSCRQYLAAFGGHPMAAGLSIDKENVSAFREAINAQCPLSLEDMQAVYRIDCALLPQDVTLDLAKQLSLLEPYGKENSEPLFAAKGLKLTRIALMGKDNQFMRLFLDDKQGRRCEIVDFRNKERLYADLAAAFGENSWSDLLSGKPLAEAAIDIIYTISVNNFNGHENVQIKAIDYRLRK